MENFRYFILFILTSCSLSKYVTSPISENKKEIKQIVVFDDNLNNNWYYEELCTENIIKPNLSYLVFSLNYLGKKITLNDSVSVITKATPSSLYVFYPINETNILIIDDLSINIKTDPNYQFIQIQRHDSTNVYLKYIKKNLFIKEFD